MLHLHNVVLYNDSLYNFGNAFISALLAVQTWQRAAQTWQGCLIICLTHAAIATVIQLVLHTYAGKGILHTFS